MSIKFYKYQGTGNDFVIIDNRSQEFNKDNAKLIRNMCHRRFGIGADGLILLEQGSAAADFTMVYFNSDGTQGSMCGNGGRCVVSFAKSLKLIGNKTAFMAYDGLHEAFIDEDNILLKMHDVERVEVFEDHTFLDTGSPHHVVMAYDLPNFPVQAKGRAIAHGEPYYEKGSNVNFVEKSSASEFLIRTYERGVEDETMSCGTGVTASAIAMYHTSQTSSNNITLKTPGGVLKVSFQKDNNTYRNVFLEGPAKKVFEGIYDC